VDHDFMILGVKNWSNLALKREEWKKLWSIPGLIQGCRANDDDDDDDDDRVGLRVIPCCILNLHSHIYPLTTIYYCLQFDDQYY
jgi:hypothetical protein